MDLRAKWLLYNSGYRGKISVLALMQFYCTGFAAVKKGEKVLDLGTGTGIIPILLEAKTEGMHFTGLEIQEESADMARRSVML